MSLPIPIDENYEQYLDIQQQVLDVIQRFSLTSDNYTTVDQLGFLSRVDDQSTREALQHFMSIHSNSDTFSINHIIDFLYFHMNDIIPPAPVSNIKNYQQDELANESMKLKIQQQEAEKSLALKKKIEVKNRQQDLELQKQKLLQELDDYQSYEGENIIIEPQIVAYNANIQQEIIQCFTQLQDYFCSRIQAQEELITERLQQKPKKTKIQSIFQVQRKNFEPKEFQKNLRDLSTQLANLARNLHKETLQSQIDLKYVFLEIDKLGSEANININRAMDEASQYVVISQAGVILCVFIIIIGQFLIIVKVSV
ncbi:hypothetical protein SS50377_23112 [Spironucleus salmonicida]|nr:hypothetical protein SS50377_23112 [Spironucleus salmonicida]